jgi:hypothetical protein
MDRKRKSIDDKITYAKEIVGRTKEKYDRAVADLEMLLVKKEEMFKAELMEAFTRSSKTYEEILAFLCNDVRK